MRGEGFDVTDDFDTKIVFKRDSHGLRAKTRIYFDILRVNLPTDVFCLNPLPLIRI